MEPKSSTPLYNKDPQNASIYFLEVMNGKGFAIYVYILTSIKNMPMDLSLLTLDAGSFQSEPSELLVLLEGQQQLSFDLCVFVVHWFYHLTLYIY